MNDNTNNAPQNEDPLQTLVAQVRMLDENIGAMIKSGTPTNEILEDYICPILHAMGVAVEQSFAAINQVAHTANFALMTSEKTLAGDSLTQVADIVNDAEAVIDNMADRIPDDLKEDFENLKSLFGEAIEVIGPWMSSDAVSEDTDDSDSVEEDSNDSEDTDSAVEEVEAEIED